MGRALEMVGPHKSQAIAVEHAADVDEESAINRFAEDNFLVD